MIDLLMPTIAQGLLWAIMALGVYITYRVLDIADLPVDSLHLAACAIVGICCDNGLGGLFCEGRVDAYNVSDGRSVG